MIPWGGSHSCDHLNARQVLRGRQSSTQPPSLCHFAIFVLLMLGCTAVRQAEQGASIPLVQRLTEDLMSWKPTLLFHEGDISYARCCTPPAPSPLNPKLEPGLAAACCSMTLFMYVLAACLCVVSGWGSLQRRPQHARLNLSVLCGGQGLCVAVVSASDCSRSTLLLDGVALHCALSLLFVTQKRLRLARLQGPVL